MKKIFCFFFVLVLLACQDKSDPPKKVNDIPSRVSIKDNMDCENCGMDLQTFILTSHAIHKPDGENLYYCSINCSTEAWRKLNIYGSSVYAIDKISIEYFPVENAKYVIGSKLPAVMSNTSKYAFKDFSEAQQFKLEQEGDTIIGYKETFEMCEKELLRR